mmetsp:Transcript_8064/g.19488  ORF Transcript_8064/g.19488 Transcript_8064/m.19488 type:complete len:477 (-) Transcript_8064:3-1433(-)
MHQRRVATGRRKHLVGVLVQLLHALVEQKFLHPPSSSSRRGPPRARCAHLFGGRVEDLRGPLRSTSIISGLRATLAAAKRRTCLIGVAENNALGIYELLRGLAQHVGHLFLFGRRRRRRGLLLFSFLWRLTAFLLLYFGLRRRVVLLGGFPHARAPARRLSLTCCGTRIGSVAVSRVRLLGNCRSDVDLWLVCRFRSRDPRGGIGCRRGSDLRGRYLRDTSRRRGSLYRGFRCRRCHTCRFHPLPGVVAGRDEFPDVLRLGIGGRVHEGTLGLVYLAHGPPALARRMQLRASERAVLVQQLHIVLVERFTGRDIGAVAEEDAEVLPLPAGDGDGEGVFLRIGVERGLGHHDEPAVLQFVARSVRRNRERNRRVVHIANVPVDARFESGGFGGGEVDGLEVEHVEGRAVVVNRLVLLLVHVLGSVLRTKRSAAAAASPIGSSNATKKSLEIGRKLNIFTPTSGAVKFQWWGKIHSMT